MTEDGDQVTATRVDHAPAEDARAGVGAFRTLWRTLREFSEDNLVDWAAALTYYGLLSLFPALIALVSVLGMFGDPVRTTRTITDVVTQIGPDTAADTFAGPIRSITANRGTAGALFFVGLGVALWSASGYVGAFMRAANVVYETPEGRPFWKRRPLQVLVTLLMVLMLAVVALALALTGPVVDAVADALGIGGTATTIWDIAKWPVLVLIAVCMFSGLFWIAPNARVGHVKRVLPGVLVGLTIWIVASAGFALYVANFGAYDKTYGTLGGIVALLVWFWLTNIALLLGLQLNAELERNRELRAGVPHAEHELQLAARSAPAERATA